MSNNNYPFNGVAHFNGNPAPTTPSSHEIAQLIDEIQSKLGSSKELTINDIYHNLVRFRDVLLQQKNTGEIDLSQFLPAHDAAINMLLLYFSIYKKERKTVVIKLRNETGAKQVNSKYKPLIRPRIRQTEDTSGPSCSDTDSNPEWEDASMSDSDCPPRELPSSLVPQSTRDSNNETLDRFNQMLKERGVRRRFRRRKRAKKVSKYVVVYDVIRQKLNELIDVIDFFREFDQCSQMIFQLRKITTKCREDLQEKHKTYNHIIGIRDTINEWHKQAQQIRDTMSNFNDSTLRCKSNEEYITSLGNFYGKGIEDLINNLPIARVTRELELAKCFTETCGKLMTPLLQSAEVQCPVCLESKTDGIHALPCGHVVCKTCLDQLSPTYAAVTLQMGMSCPNCRTTFEKSKAIKLFLNPAESSDAPIAPEQTPEMMDPMAGVYAGGPN